MSMTYREALRALHDERGDLTAAAVVESAERNESEIEQTLHGALEWDDSKAGHAFRLMQAQRLIRKFKVAYRVDEVSPRKHIREWTSVERVNPPGRVYEPTIDVLRDPLLSAITLRDLERRWRELYEIAQRYPEFMALIRRDIEGSGDVA